MPNKLKIKVREANGVTKEDMIKALEQMGSAFNTLLLGVGLYDEGPMADAFYKASTDPKVMKLYDSTFAKDRNLFDTNFPDWCDAMVDVLKEG